MHQAPVGWRPWSHHTVICGCHETTCSGAFISREFEAATVDDANLQHLMDEAPNKLEDRLGPWLNNNSASLENSTAHFKHLLGI